VINDQKGGNGKAVGIGRVIRLMPPGAAEIFRAFSGARIGTPANLERRA